MRVYLAGPMTGIEDYNYPAFHAAAECLRECGYEVDNPAENFGGNQSMPYETYMRTAIQSVLACDVVRVLDGWKESRGALTEVLVALRCNIPVVTYEFPTLIREDIAEVASLLSARERVW